MLKEIKNEIEKAREIVVVGHQRPDGDAVSSTAVLTNIIKEKFEKEVYGFIDDHIPEEFKQFINIENFRTEINKPDLVIFVDTPALKMAGKNISEYIEQNNVKTICIDHHKTNGGYADINWVEDYSSCSEMIFETALEYRFEITEKTATSLLLGICTDTGFFKNSNANQFTFYIVSRLLESGANLEIIRNKIQKQKQWKDLWAVPEALKHMMKNESGSIVATYISLEEMSKLGKGKPPMIADLLLERKGVESVVVLFEIEKGSYKAMFRSLEKDMSLVAKRHNGGGHKYACGCTITTNLFPENIMEDLIKEIEEI